jgi:hypothetical protein
VFLSVVLAGAQSYDVRTLSQEGQAAYSERALSVSSDAITFGALIKGDAADPEHAWHAYRAGTPISEEELFALVGDPEKSRRAERYRRNRSGQKTAGLIVGVAGFAGMLASGVYMLIGPDDSTPGVTTMLISSPFAITGEMLFLFAGPPNCYSKSEALQAAELYNRNLIDELRQSSGK